MSSTVPITSILFFYCIRWLDTLGVAATMRHSRVFRQQFKGSNYGLLDPDFQPTPVSTRT